MNKELQKLKHAITTIRLTDDEKTCVRESLREIIKKPISRNWWSVLVWNLQENRMVLSQRIAGATMALVLIFVGSGVALAAERSLPGDALYSVKTHFNEAIITFLTVSDEGKAKVQTEFAEKRIKEANKLSAQNRLDSQKKEFLQERIKEHTIAASKHIEDLKNKKDYEAVVDLATNLETALDSRNVVVTKDESDNLDTSFAAHIAKEAAQVTVYRTEGELNLEDMPDSDIKDLARDKKKEAYHAINDAEDYIDEHFFNLPTTFTSLSQNELASARLSLSTGFEYFNTQNFRESYVHFNTALRYAQGVQSGAQALVEVVEEVGEVDVIEQPTATSSPTSTSPVLLIQ